MSQRNASGGGHETLWPTPTVVVVADPLDGPLLLVGGRAPLVACVEYARGAIGGYHLTQADGEWTNPRGTLWPTVVPSVLRVYDCVAVVPLLRLRAVEVLRTLGGQLRREDLWWVWQAATGTVEEASEREVRRALASVWFRRLRDPAVVDRGIRLRQ